MDMLALTIKDGETLHIGDDIKIVINKVKGSETKLAVEAPKTVKVLRGKLKG
jgi:carbon storage regulator